MFFSVGFEWPSLELDTVTLPSRKIIIGLLKTDVLRSNFFSESRFDIREANGYRKGKVSIAMKFFFSPEKWGLRRSGRTRLSIFFSDLCEILPEVLPDNGRAITSPTDGNYLGSFRKYETALKIWNIPSRCYIFFSRTALHYFLQAFICIKSKRRSSNKRPDLLGEKSAPNW